MSRGYREACNYSKYAQFDFHDQSPKTQALREQKALQKKALETERVKAGGRAAVPAGDEGNKRDGRTLGLKASISITNHGEYDLRDWAHERESRFI
ncbi:hypothetical protein L202_04402 [Cryptococcus amylolentus CBS 6039]|uniref:Uncharacterized protein n=1 Tax=Cryptococcus amylolentus CBS 6039 TaxID=1295533 RepID=A0A1E3HR94_9TREE|nr:hypothetical protein L202_04402 [Cryptococcus amylolentus CBS 6039]ODN78864.1 hypothetical protein L202_04402 [Cryptococcus amylolentus CBS 6039]